MTRVDALRGYIAGAIFELWQHEDQPWVKDLARQLELGLKKNGDNFNAAASVKVAPGAPDIPALIERAKKHLSAITSGEWSWEDDGNEQTYGQCRKATLYAGDRQWHGLNLLGRLEPDSNGRNNLDFIAASPVLVRELADALTTLSASHEALTHECAINDELRPASDTALVNICKVLNVPLDWHAEPFPSEPEVLAAIEALKQERDAADKLLASSQPVQKLRLQLAAAEAHVAALTAAVQWALGEAGEFPTEPINVPRRRYWWRTELRQRAFGAERPRPEPGT